MDENNEVVPEEILDALTPLTAQMEEHIYRHFWSRLMGIAMRYVGEKELAKEVVNDSFLKAFDNISKFKGKGQDRQLVFRVWLVRITVNTAIDRLRVKRLVPEMDPLGDGEHLPHVDMDDSLNYQDILQLLQRLPDLHRIVFNLYELEGYTHEEIGKMLRIPISSSRVYLAKAKERLRVLYTKRFGRQ